MWSVFNVVMRIVSSLLGLLMIGMGSIWMMQGLNVGPAAILQGPDQADSLRGQS